MQPSRHFLTWEFLFNKFGQRCAPSPMIPMQTSTTQRPILWAKYFSHTLNYPPKVGCILLEFFLRVVGYLRSSISPLPTLWPTLTWQSPTTRTSVSPTGILSFYWIYSTIWCYSHMGNVELKYLLNLPRKRPNSEHSWKQFIVSLYTLTRALCHYGCSHKAETGSVLPYHLSQCSFMDKKHYSYILLAWNWLC